MTYHPQLTIQLYQSPVSISTYIIFSWGRSPYIVEFNRYGYIYLTPTARPEVEPTTRPTPLAFGNPAISEVDNDNG